MARILVAEDERDIRDLVSLTLDYNGHNVVTVKDGLEAVRLVSSDSAFDLILMDVRMPRMTGYEACRLLKAVPATEHIPVVFLSAKGQESEVNQGLEVGALQYILKPFAPDVLIEKIQEVLSSAESVGE